MTENCDLLRQERLAGIGELASTLDELLASPDFSHRPALQIAKESRCGRWLDAVAAGDRVAFQRRLAWDCTSGGRVAAAPSPVGTGWISWIEEVFEQAPVVAAELFRGDLLAEATSCGEPIPFLELWVPFLRVARARLEARTRVAVDRFIATVRQDLERHLLLDFAVRGAWAAYESFDLWRRLPAVILTAEAVSPGRRLYDSFIHHLLSDGLGDFLVSYSSLARRLATTAAQWVEATAELMERLTEDLADLEAVFNGGEALGQVTAVARLSEPHGGGRRVMALTMSEGRKLVYKPRPVAGEAAFQSLLCWLTTKGIACAPAHFKMVSRNGYGWSEWLQPSAAKSVAEVERYFERAGALLCLVELLGGDDLHAENVVATAEGPVLIDAETLLQPLMEEVPSDAPPRFRSQFVTSPQIDGAGNPYDLGGLQGHVRWLGESRRPTWVSVNTDAMSIEYRSAFMEPGANLFYWEGRPCLPAAHRGALADGFAAVYRLLLEHREELLADEGPLAAFRPASSRILLRSSQQYATLVARLRQARFQSSGMATDVLIETAARPFVCDHVRPRGWDLIAEERRALREGDIPRFEVQVEDTRIELPDGRLIAGCFSVSGLEAVRRRISLLSEAGLAEWLRELGRLWTRPAVPRRIRSGAEEEHPIDPVVLSLSFGRRLAEGRGAGRARGLYEGGLGVAVLLAALARLTGDRRLGAQSVALALEDLGRPLPRARGGEAELGSFAGLGGDLYGSACIVHWLHAPAVADSAASRLRQVGLRDLNGAPPDLAAGLAGCIAGALAFAAVTGDPAARALADAAGNRLAARLDDCTVSQPGVAHGFAGISLAFLRLSAASGDRGWIPLGRRAWEREWQVRAQDPGFLPGLTRQGLGWCRGSSGLGLVMLELLQVEPAKDRPLELTMAVAAVREDWTSDRDSLCCGMGGELDLLLEASHAPGPPGLAKRMGPLCTAWWRRLAKGSPRLGRDRLGRNRPRVGLFRGSAGVGYQLLRTSQPERWPSILAFQPPSFVDNDRR